MRQLSSKSLSIYVFLVSLFCIIVITGNLIFQKFININIYNFSIELSVGVLLYPITYLISDLVAEFFGKKPANYMINLSVIFSFIVYLLIYLCDFLSATSWSPVDNNTFRKVFRFHGVGIFSSLVAIYIAQLADVRIFLYIKKITSNKYLWLRNNVSTFVAQIIDTFCVTFVLFLFNVISAEHHTKIFLSSISFKILAALCDTPFFYFGCFLVNKFIKVKK